MNLRANTVQLVFEPNCSRCALPLPNGSAVRFRTCQHASNRLKERQFGIFEAVLPREKRHLPNVTKQHMGFSNGADLALEGRSDGIFKQALFEANAEVAGENANQITRGRRGHLLEDAGQDLRLEDGATRLPQAREKLADFGQGERAGSRLSAHDFCCGQPGIVVPAANRAKVGL